MRESKEKYKSKLINPVSISPQDFPLIVLVDNMKSLFSLAIKWHTSGRYSHAMEYYAPLLVASQDLVGYRKVPLIKYLKPHVFLKFWKVNLTPSQRAEWFKLIEEDLKKGAKYDFLAMLGQLLRMPWIQNPKKDFCSEKVARHQNAISDIGLPDHPSPVGLDNLFGMIEQMSVYGYHFMEGK